MEHDFPFDPTYGFSLDTLLRVDAPAGPADFADFWRSMYERTLRVPPRTEVRALRGDANSIIHEIEYDSLDGFRVGGWLATPLDGKITRGMVIGHGYGGRGASDWDPSQKGAAVLFPCARGFNRSARPDLPDNAYIHVLHGIASRDTYLHGRCAADLWAAVTALTALYPHVAGKIDFRGGSFGGGIGALALPWEQRFRRAFLEVPSFGNHPLRVTLPCNGSGKSVRTYYQTHPEVLKVLAYFDAATAASHTTTPTFVANALFDPAVPPPGQFAIFNALAGEKRLFVRKAGHFSYPDEAREYNAMIGTAREWFIGE